MGKKSVKDSRRDSGKDREYLTPVEVAELLMVSTASVRLWAAKGLLPAQTTAGGHRRFLRSDIVAFARARGIDPVWQANNGLKILLLTNDRELGGYLGTALENQPGMESLVIAKSGFEAGLKLIADTPAVMLVDTMLPGIDSVDVCTLAKGQVQSRDVRVIAITGKDSAVNVESLLAAGAEACLAKPLQKEALFDLLGLVVYQSSMGESA